MPPFRLHSVLLIAALLLTLLTPAASEPDDRVHRHAAALHAYEAGDWATAYRAFATLAERGHRPAARMALLMATRGPVLYGQVFDADALQRQRWAAMQMPPLPVDFFATGQQMAMR